MTNEIATYIRRHTVALFIITIIVFVALALGEYQLYRNEMKLNKMLSEGLMQLKEQVNTQNQTTWQKIDVKPTVTPAKK